VSSQVTSWISIRRMAVRDARALRDVAKAFTAKARAEADLADAVSVARAEGHSWTAIGIIRGAAVRAPGRLAVAVAAH
jgi:hypothetical protein